MDKVEKNLKYLSGVRDISHPSWLCIFDYKLGQLHLQIVKCPDTGMYQMYCPVTKLKKSGFDLMEVIKSFFLAMAGSIDPKVTGFRPKFVRYYEFIRKLECEPMLF